MKRFAGMILLFAFVSAPVLAQSVKERLKKLETKATNVETRLTSLEQCKVYYGAVNPTGAAAGNIPDGLVGRSSPGVYHLNFGKVLPSLDVYNAVIVASGVRPAGQPVTVNASNKPGDEHHALIVEIWAGGVPTDAAFRFVVVVAPSACPH